MDDSEGGTSHGRPAERGEEKSDHLSFLILKTRLGRMTGSDVFILGGLLKTVEQNWALRSLLSVEDEDIWYAKRFLEEWWREYREVMRIKRFYNELWLEHRKFFLFRNMKKVKRLALRVDAMLGREQRTYEELDLDEEFVKSIIGE